MCDSAVCEKTEIDIVKSEIEKKLEIFDDMCRLSGIIEIDGVTENGNIKIINHSNQEAYEVEINTIIKTPVKDLMLALETGVHINLYQISRIVGYFSRINNWNKSKKSELFMRVQGREKGGYYVGENHKPTGIKKSLETISNLSKYDK